MKITTEILELLQSIVTVCARLETTQSRNIDVFIHVDKLIIHSAHRINSSDAIKLDSDLDANSLYNLYLKLVR